MTDDIEEPTPEEKDAAAAVLADPAYQNPDADDGTVDDPIEEEE